MVAGVRSNDLGPVAQSYATLDQRLLQLLDLLKVAVCHPFVAQGPHPFGGLELRRARRQELQVYSFGNLDFLARVPCHPARSKTSRMRFLVPAPTSLAKCSKANENTSALTVGRISQ